MNVKEDDGGIKGAETEDTRYVGSITFGQMGAFHDNLT
jgi:hypothetical protein